MNRRSLRTLRTCACHSHMQRLPTLHLPTQSDSMPFATLKSFHAASTENHDHSAYRLSPSTTLPMQFASPGSSALQMCAHTWQCVRKDDQISMSIPAKQKMLSPVTRSFQQQKMRIAMQCRQTRRRTYRRT